MRKKRILISILAIGGLALGIVITLVFISPPAMLPAEAQMTEFSAGRAMQDLKVIARVPRPMGEFPAHAEVRNYLLSEIRALDLEPQVQDTFGVRVVEPGFLLGGPVENILARLPGSDPDGAILLIAHYDSTPGAPGAGDNGSGVVILLELLRNLDADSPLRQDVIALFTDGHEPGIIGTHAFVAQHPLFGEVQLVINMDFRGGPPTLASTNQGNGLWIETLAQTAQRPTYLSLPLHLFPSGDSDLIPFKETGIPGASFGSAASLQEIHTMLDRPEIVDPDMVQQTGNHILALVRSLGNKPTLEIGATSIEHSPEQTYFPILGRLVHYPTSWAWLLTIVASLCSLATIAYGFRKGELNWKEMSRGLLTLVASLVLSLGITYLLWAGIQSLHPEYQYSPVRPHLSDDQLYAIGFTGLALGITAGLIAVARKVISTFNLAAGALVFWCLTTIAVTAILPGTSYLAIWVLLSSALILLLGLVIQSRKGAWLFIGLGFLFSAILATFLWIPVIYRAFIGPGFTMLWMVIGVVGLWLVAMLPALDLTTSPKRWVFPMATTLVSLSILVGGHFVVGKDSPPPLVNSIGYWLDVEDQQAYWIAFMGGQRVDARTSARYEVAFPAEMDERQHQLLLNPIRRDYRELFPKAPDFSVLTSEAPMLAQEGPSLEIISDKWINNQRVLKIRFEAGMRDRLYIVIPEASLEAIRVLNNDRSVLAESTEWWLRFDGMPSEGVEILFKFSNPQAIQFLLVEEKTGLASFPGLSTQPEPGTMRSPGEFLQGDETDFTAIYRRFEVPAFSGG